MKTDASNTNWAGVLEWCEVGEDGKQNPQHKIAKYASGSFHDTEQRWSTFDQELRAVVKSLKAFKFFLFEPFELLTDSSAVVGFLKNRNLTPDSSAKQVREKISILAYQDRITKIGHISGKHNFVADALTRHLA